jgi:hypothetical protein
MNLTELANANRATATANYRARRAANNRRLGLDNNATPAQVHAAIMAASK